MKHEAKLTVIPKVRWLFFFLAPLCLLGQPELGKCDQEIDEVTARQIERAQQAWRSKDFRRAERYLEKAVRLNDQYAHALYLLGELKMRQTRLRQARALWKRLLDNCPEYKPDVYYFFGVMEHEDGNYLRAIELIEKFLNSPERSFGFDQEAKLTLEEARLRRDLKANPVPYDPKPLPRLSTPADEYLASISPDQQSMYFTRREEKVYRKDGPASKVRMVEEFSKASRQGAREFSQGQAMPTPFNSNYNEGGPSITATNSELYFTVCQDLDGYKNCDIYYAWRDSMGYWTSPRSVGDHINTRDNWESQPSVDAEGENLYFASDRDGGEGGLDIYRCRRQSNGEWAAPQALPKTVNTPKDEKTPFIHSDSETLYFTSNGHPGMGGFDIFLARSTTDTSWAAPENIGYPINDEGDDLGLFVSLDGQTAYFASNKLRSNTGWDIFYFALPKEVRPQQVALISGRLRKEDTAQFSGTRVEIRDLASKKVNSVRVNQHTGEYAGIVSTREQGDYVVSVKKKGMAFSSRYVSSEGLQEQKVVTNELQLAPLEVGREYTLNDIKFATNSYQLSFASRAIIEEFVKYLRDNPELQADIQGHTDNVGDKESNLRLSRNRAQAVYDYVVKQGIDPQRLSHHGYGERRPIASNETEEGRAQNRRTVFVVTAGAR